MPYLQFDQSEVPSAVIAATTLTKSAQNVSQEALKRIHSGRIAFVKAVYCVVTLILMAMGGALAHWLFQRLK
jgi:hypothetical protein